MNIFFLSFSIYYFVNRLFFNEKIIHKIYIDEGKYNFVYLIPYISFSFLIGHILIIILKYFSLSERNLYEIKIEDNYLIAYDKVEKVHKNLIIKYICFFVLGFLFLLFLWYFLSSFGAVYKNTQVYLIKNTLISFSFELLFPFIFNLLPGIIRFSSLTRSNKEGLYKFSKFIQII